VCKKGTPCQPCNGTKFANPECEWCGRDGCDTSKLTGGYYPCPDCGGASAVKCGHCGGTGYAITVEHYEVPCRLLLDQAADIVSSLNIIASQESCDGEPYDTMVKAADYIEYLRKKIKSEQVNG